MSEVIDLADLRNVWVVTLEVCRTCGARCIGVLPIDADLDRIECSSCTAPTSAVTHFDGEPTNSADACARFREITGPERAEPSWRPRLELARDPTQAETGKPAHPGDPKAD